MQADTQSAPVSKKRLWTGRIIRAVVVLFLLFDGVMKFIKPAPVVEAFAHLGWPISLAAGLGIILLASTVIYAIPSTSFLGAILLTGYLGGAVATHLRIGDPLFDTLFPIIFGVLIWIAIFLRDDRLRTLLTVRS